MGNATNQGAVGHAGVDEACGRPAAALDEYAHAMFRHERLHDRWVAHCARWLVELFPNGLRGRTVVDYGCGRGNWSLAFLEAGADSVIAIDGAKSNCDRLAAYAADRGILDLHVVHGNVLEGPVDARGDLIWLHGVLHHVEQADEFLDRILDLGDGPDAQFHVYHYDAGSLRETTVEASRRLARCETEDAFGEIAPAFTRAARIRASDDLVAPHISWRTAGETAALLRRHGLYPIRQDGSFTRFRRGWESEEFQPHHFLCGLDRRDETTVREPPRPWTAELVVLRRLLDALCVAELPAEERRLLGVGLMNTHFGAIEQQLFARRALDELFLFSLGHLVRIGERGLRRDGDERVSAWCELAVASSQGSAAELDTDLPDLQITRLLRETAIRL